MTTRTRIITEAMESFGRLGYAATTVARIEEAAGLSAGSGGLYKHFPSKRAVLEAGVHARMDAPDALTALFAAAAAEPDVRAALRAILGVAIARLDYERDLNRILVRDLAAFPDLLELFRRSELDRLHGGLTRALAALAPASERDSATVAAILLSAVSHYWLLADVFGGVHPLGIERERYLDAVADLATAAIGTDGVVTASSQAPSRRA